MLLVSLQGFRRLRSLAEPILAPAPQTPLPLTRRNVALPAAIAAGELLLLLALFMAWVHYSFEGKYWGPFLPGSRFGVPAKEAAAGMYPNTLIGWDGQFYYYQSNDPLALGDSHKNLDTPSYRYQRIGVPAVAYAVGRLLGYELTPAAIYHGVQFAFTCAGLGILMHWLMAAGVNPLYAFCWLLGAGTFNALFFGMPDPVADALFIASLYAAATGRLGLYVPAATLMLLTREGYAVVAGMVFLYTALGKFRWNDRAGYWTRTVLAALPGILLVAWIGYVTWRFGKSPGSANAGGKLVDWPLAGFWKTLEESIAVHNNLETFLKLFNAWFLLLIAQYLGRHARSAIVQCCIPYFLLTTMLGPTVWADFSGHMKASGTIAILGVVLLTVDKSRFLRLALAAYCLVGLYVNYKFKFQHPPLFFEHRMTDDFDLGPLKGEHPKVNDHRSTIVALDVPTVVDVPALATWGWLHRQTMRIEVDVTNQSGETWRSDVLHRPVHLGYRWFDADGRVVRSAPFRARFRRPLEPGQTQRLSMIVGLPHRPGAYTLRIAPVQEGVVFFDDVRPESGWSGQVAVR